MVFELLPGHRFDGTIVDLIYVSGTEKVACIRIADVPSSPVFTVPRSRLTVTHHRPAGWPVRAGDVWESQDNDQRVSWFFYDDPVSGTLSLRNERGDFVDGRADTADRWLLDHCHDLKLVYRRPQPEDDNG